MPGDGSTDLSWATWRAPTLVGTFALGVSCVMTQLALMREMLGVFAGNELVFGVVLGNWLILMGAGAALGRWSGGRPGWRLPALSALLVMTAVLPPVQIVLVRHLRQLVFLPGEEIGVVGTVLASAGVLLPYCLAAGAFLAVACGICKASDAAVGAGRIYATDSLGSVAGGMVFSFVLVTRLDHVSLLAFPAVLNLLSAGWLGWKIRRERAAWGEVIGGGSLAAGAALLVWIAWADPDASSTARQFPGQQLLFRGSSPYGRLAVTASGGQTNIIENGIALASIPNIESAEESVHFALAQRPGAGTVLLIGGMISGSVRELLRHRVSRVDCVELDPLIVSLGRQLLPGDLGDPRLRWIEADARHFVRQAKPGYDVILVVLPDPTTAQLNRFFTQEFFQDVRHILRPGGILSFAVGRYENYASPELTQVLSCARQTVSRSFSHLLLVPAGRVYFIASDEPLRMDIATALEEARVGTSWVNRNYLAATLSPDRVEGVRRVAQQAAPVNRDFAPALYYLQLRHWASQFEGKARWLVILLMAFSVVWLARLPSVGRVIFASGFAGSALEIILLLAMQTLVGAVYQRVAWVVTLFMAGLALGAWVATRRINPEASRAGSLKNRDKRVALCLLGLGIAVAAALLPVLLPTLANFAARRGSEWATQGFLLVYTFGLAAMVGAQFPLANASLGAPRCGLVADTAADSSTSVASAPTAARLYAADFIGASLGAFATGVCLVPLLGLAGVCWIAGGLNLAAGLLLLQRKFS